MTHLDDEDIDDYIPVAIVEAFTSTFIQEFLNLMRDL